MSQLAVRLLGPPHIERDGAPVKVETRKGIALLAYIAIAPAAPRRATLVTLLWPEYSHARGRANLRRTLYALRRDLGDAWLVGDGQHVHLQPDADIWIDVVQFRRFLGDFHTHSHPETWACSACAGALCEAVALYRDEFLAGFSLKDSLHFDDWQLSIAGELHYELIGALERLVAWHSAQREFDMALAYGKRWLALDPLDERIHCELMRLHTWSGQRAAALCQYEACAHILRDQLGISPQEATTALYRTIQTGRVLPGPPAYPSPEPAQASIERPVFVCRERELAQLDGFLDAALDGHGRVAFVTGEAGSGKTALLREFVWRAQATHANLVVAGGHGNAHTGAGDSYLPFRQVLGLLSGDVENGSAGLMTGEQARRLWQLLPQTVQALVKAGPDLVDLFVPGAALIQRARAVTPLPVGPVWLTQLEQLVRRRATRSDNTGLRQSALFEQYTQVLRVLAKQSPLLLTLDDLQWADSGSIDLLFHLGRQLEGRRILILGAYRPSEVAWGRPAVRAGQRGLERHPLEPVVNEFKRHFGAVEIDLEQAEGRRFVNAFLDSEPNRFTDAFRESLCQRTGGYPLFTVELLRDMQERGDLVCDADGCWAEGPTLDWQTLPARLEGAIAERINRLPVELRDVLTVASVEGEGFTAEVVARVRTEDEAELVHSLSDVLAKRHRLVRAEGVQHRGEQRLSRYRFGHILFQEYLYNSLDRVEQAHLHQAVGTVFEDFFGADAAAMAVTAPELALHFQKAGIARKAIVYLRQAGERAKRLYANQEAVEHFRQALTLLESTSTDEGWSDLPPELAAGIREDLGDVLALIGEHDEAQNAYREALIDVPYAEGIWRARLFRKTGNIDRLQQRHERALETYRMAQSSLELAPVAPDPVWWQEWSQIQIERLWLHYWLGQWREMSTLADRVQPTLEQHGTPSQRIDFLFCLGNMAHRRDRYVVSEETLGHFRTALAISLESDNLGQIAWARFSLGFAQLWYGDFDGAAKELQTALALAERTGDVVVQSRCSTYLTILYRKRGQQDRVSRYAARSLEAATAAQMTEYVAAAQANLAWLAWREGDLAQAQAKGRLALRTWHQLATGRSSTAFEWQAIWPLTGALLAQNRTAEAVKCARLLLDPTQQRLPDPLTKALENAIATWEAGQSRTADAWMERALGLAQSQGDL